MTFLSGNGLTATGEGDRVDAEDNTRFSGGFLEPRYVFEGDPLFFCWRNFLYYGGQTIVTKYGIT